MTKVREFALRKGQSLLGSSDTSEIKESILGRGSEEVFSWYDSWHKEHSRVLILFTLQSNPLGQLGQEQVEWNLKALSWALGKNSLSEDALRMLLNIVGASADTGNQTLCATAGGLAEASTYGWSNWCELPRSYKSKMFYPAILASPIHTLCIVRTSYHRSFQCSCGYPEIKISDNQKAMTYLERVQILKQRILQRRSQISTFVGMKTMKAF